MQNWEALAGVLVPIVLILTTGGVLVLRPIARRLGELLEVMARDRTRPPPDELRRLGTTIDTLSDRLSLVEERQDFTERLIGRGRSGGGEEPAE